MNVKMGDKDREKWVMLEYGFIPANPGLYTLYIDNVAILGDAKSIAVPPDVLAKKINMASVPEIKPDQTQLVYPSVPEGYTIALKYSGNKDVLTLDGKITPPAKDRYVAVVFTVTSTMDGRSADTAEFSILIPKSAKAAEKPDDSKDENLDGSTDKAPSTGVGSTLSVISFLFVTLSMATLLLTKKQIG